MAAIEILHAQPQVDAAQVRSLFWEYLRWANAGLNREYGIGEEAGARLTSDRLTNPLRDARLPICA
jgi:hypothetical protein